MQKQDIVNTAGICPTMTNLIAVCCDCTFNADGFDFDYEI